MAKGDKTVSVVIGGRKYNLYICHIGEVGGYAELSERLSSNNLLQEAIRVIAATLEQVGKRPQGVCFTVYPKNGVPLQNGDALYGCLKMQFFPCIE